MSTVGFGRVVPWMLIAAGVLVLAAGANEVRHAGGSRAWPTSQGVVTSTSLERTVTPSASDGGASGGTWQPLVSYEYAVAGRSYQGQRVSFADAATGDRAAAAAILKKYSPGAAVVVHYDPDDPAEAVLEPGDAPFPWYRVRLGLGLLAAGALLVIALPRIAGRRR